MKSAFPPRPGMKPHVHDMNSELDLAVAVQAPQVRAAITTLDDIRRAANALLRWENHYIVSTRESWWWKRYGPAATPKEPDDYADWNKSIEEIGRASCRERGEIS